MDIGLFGGGDQVDDIVASAGTVRDRGFHTLWVPQIFGADALTALAVAVREVPDVRVGTAVIPTFPRHPVALATQALTVQQVAGPTGDGGARLTLGIGLSHQLVIEGLFGIPWDKPVRHMKEYLAILQPLLRGEAADVAGETLSAHVGLGIRDTVPVPVVVAALGPQMLKVCARLADGTITWMTGPETLRSHTVPTLTAATEEAGRPAPRVVCCLPVAVTDDPDGAREQAAAMFAMYGSLPSYRAMLDREGAAGPADVAIVGDEATVKAGIAEVEEAGATEFVAVPFAETDRTLDVLQSLLP